MDFNFVKFEAKNKRAENRITITKAGYIGFPTNFYESNNIRQYSSVALFYDKANNAIGLSFSNDVSDKSLFKILHSEKYGGSIVARSFFKANDIDPKVYHGRYLWIIHKQEGIGDIFVIQLEQRKDK